MTTLPNGETTPHDVIGDIKILIFPANFLGCEDDSSVDESTLKDRNQGAWSGSVSNRDSTSDLSTSSSERHTQEGGYVTHSPLALTTVNLTDSGSTRCTNDFQWIRKEPPPRPVSPTKMEEEMAPASKPPISRSLRDKTPKKATGGRWLLFSLFFYLTDWHLQDLLRLVVWTGADKWNARNATKSPDRRTWKVLQDWRISSRIWGTKTATVAPHLLLTTGILKVFIGDTRGRTSDVATLI